MEPHHLAGVMDIEVATFSDPWTDDAWGAELAYHESWCYVAVDGANVVVGVLALRKMVDEVHIMKLSVRDDLRRQGIASKLIAYGLRELRTKGCRRAVLELRRSNHAAAAFYRKLGFVPEGVRQGYYRNPAEDALLMGRKL